METASLVFVLVCSYLAMAGLGFAVGSEIAKEFRAKKNLTKP